MTVVRCLCLLRKQYFIIQTLQKFIYKIFYPGLKVDLCLCLFQKQYFINQTFLKNIWKFYPVLPLRNGQYSSQVHYTLKRTTVGYSETPVYLTQGIHLHAIKELFYWIKFDSMQLHNNAVHNTAVNCRYINKRWLMFVLASNEITLRPIPEDFKLENINWFLMFSLKINSRFSIWNSLYSVVISVSFPVCGCLFRLILTSCKEKTSHFNADVWWRQPRYLPLEHGHSAEISVRKFLFFSDIKKPFSLVQLLHSECEMAEKIITSSRELF